MLNRSVVSDSLRWGSHWQVTPVLLPRKSQGRRSMVACSPLGCLRVGHDWATSLSLSLSCIGERNGNPLQCSCLENPRDGGAWWAAVYGVAQSRTRLKRLSSSSSHYYPHSTGGNKDLWHPRWPSGWDPMFSKRGAQFWSLVWDPDPTCYN